MSVAAGTKLGTYEITGAIGSGGMGEVYRANDTKLGRDVAIKVLPEAFAHDSERLARFQREAKMLASLNHPNIATIHGLEHSNSTHFLIMELVPGETLAERIKREGAVPVEEALKVAVQIAEALEAAHEKGIIHRDLKPANVKVTPEGKVKVLDFGLAKAFAGDTADSNPSQSPTLSAVATMQGVLLGTAAYMSLEQARGKAVDKRTDIWAFGCVLYEMLTGKQAFDGEDITEILAAVVKTEPDWQVLPPTTPAQISILLRRCLRKDRQQRLRDAADVRIEIEEALSAPVNILPAAPKVRRAAIWRWALASGLACLAIGAIATALVLGVRGRERPPDVARVLVNVAPAETVAPSSANLPHPTRMAITLSPDGKYLVFSATRGGKQQLYLRAMDRLEATPIAGTEGSDSPFFSPDGQWLGFWQGTLAMGATGELKKVSLSGGPALALCKTGPLYGASWGSNDTIVFANQIGGGLWRVSAAGGTPQVLTTPDPKKGEFSHRLPQMLPGSQAVLFTILRAYRRWDDAQIAVRSLVTSEQKVLLEGSADARYVRTGHLVYARNGTLLAAPFDLAQLKMTGNPVGMVEGVMQDVNDTLAIGDTGAAQFSVSDSGGLVYLPGGIVPNFEVSLVWVDRAGRTEPLPLAPRAFGSPRLSPDGQRLAFHTTQTNRNVWVYDISRGASSQMTTEGQNNQSIWSPDGKRVTFGSAAAGPFNLFWKAADSSGPAERLTTDEHSQYPSSWSPDGKTLAFIQVATQTSYEIWTLSLEGGAAKSRPFVQTPFLNRWAEFSPDGRWLAYVSNESGRDEVYVQPYPGPGGRQQVSTEGGVAPAWARNGKELFYAVPASIVGTIPATNDALKMMAVDVTSQPTFTAGKPKMLFAGRYINNTPVRGYDVTPDGRRFLMMQAKEQPPAPALTEIVLVQNWFEELKRRVPTGK